MLAFFRVGRLPSNLHMLLSGMVGLLFRTAMPFLPFVIFACDAPPASQKKVTAAPTESEESVLNLSLAGMSETKGSCLMSTVSPPTDVLWPDSLSFKGKGGLVRAGDARFDEMARTWARAEPERSAAFRTPVEARKFGYRIVDDASSVRSCRQILTVYSPIFEGDFAFVITDVQTVGITGGQIHVSILQHGKNQWETIASGNADWGRPII